MELPHNNLHDEQLEKITCMKLPGTCLLYEIKTQEELSRLPTLVKHYPGIIVIGWGSNFICNSTESSKKVFLRLACNEILTVYEDEKSIRLKISGGCSWDALVDYAVKNDYAGIECLSAIPGTVGAAPVQNIGAYGSELKDTFVSCTVFDRQDFTWKTFLNKDCHFGYRASIFNSTEKNRYIISDVILELSKERKSKEAWYPSLADYFQKQLIENPTLNQVRDAVIAVRWSKLPKPEELGNCGSFFKNPVVPEALYKKLKSQFPTLSANKTDDDTWKLAAGQLIELAGLKGNKSPSGHFGMYEKNALVLVHFGGGTFEELFEYAHLVQEKVLSTFGVQLEIEPTIIE